MGSQDEAAMAAVSPLAIPAAPAPDVSAVMVVYGKFDLARKTLESLVDTLSDNVSVEVIVVDNASPDGAGARLRDDIDGATFVMSPTNLGYGSGANLGALHSRGRYVAILNSDLEFSDDWLGPLVSALDGDPTLAAAVPLYVWPSGAVLDGGRLLGADGAGYAYGDRMSVDDPQLLFPRRVDFGAAAAMLVRRAAFDQVGGFDPVYGLGYYEDTDLGFALRAAGYETVYVPRSRVTHVQGGSFGRKLRDAQAERNFPIFMDRFATWLRGRPALSRPPYDPHRELIVRDWWANDRLLVLDGSGALGGFAEAVQRRWPRARVTCVGPGASGDPHCGVEWIGAVARLDRWLESRRFHYSAVVLDATLPSTVAALLDRSQPQARRGVWGGGASPPDVEVPARPDASRVMAQLGFGA